MPVVRLPRRPQGRQPDLRVSQVSGSEPTRSALLFADRARAACARRATRRRRARLRDSGALLPVRPKRRRASARGRARAQPARSAVAGRPDGAAAAARRGGPCAARDAREALALGRVYGRAGLEARACERTSTRRGHPRGRRFIDCGCRPVERGTPRQSRVRRVNRGDPDRRSPRPRACLAPRAAPRGSRGVAGASCSRSADARAISRAKRPKRSRFTTSIACATSAAAQGVRLAESGGREPSCARRRGASPPGAD